MRRPLLSELTLEEKVLQMLMLGQHKLFGKIEDGKEMRRSEEEVEACLKRYPYGSLWCFGRVKMSSTNMAEHCEANEKPTLEDNRRFVEKVSKHSRIPMLFAMDCEKGAGPVFSDATTTTKGLAVGAANSEELTFELSAAIASEMKAAGANWRWYPVVDMPNRLANVSVGRSYSDNPERLVKLATAAIRGSESERVASTVKHFPGCDPYEIRDAHLVTTMIQISYEEWEKTQGKVFKDMIDAGVMSIMTTHSAFPAVDDEKLGGQYIPATFSKKIIQGILREKMGFEGVIITDGIDMGGMSSVCSYEEKIIRAINAGHDVILGAGPYDSDFVCQAVLDGRIPMERIDESCNRVLDMKEKLGLFDETEEEQIDVPKANRRTEEADREIAEASITLLYDRNQILPLLEEKVKKVGIIWSSHSKQPAEEALAVMRAELEKRGAEVEILSGHVVKAVIDRLAAEKDMIFYIGYVASHIPMGTAFLNGDVVQTYTDAFSAGNEKSIGISMGYPYLHHDCMQGANTFINIYEPAPESQKALVKALYGEIPFQGTSPLDIEPKLRYVYC